MDCSLPGSSIHGIFQAKVLEWLASSFSTVRLKLTQDLTTPRTGLGGGLRATITFDTDAPLGQWALRNYTKLLLVVPLGTVSQRAAPTGVRYTSVECRWTKGPTPDDL